MKKTEQTIIIKFVLSSTNDDMWEPYPLDNTKDNQYIFDGKITERDITKC